MKRIIVLPSFERSFKKLTPQEKEQTVQALADFNSMLVDGDFSVGLGFKKINHNKFELRVNIRLRVIMKLEGNVYYLVLTGSHDDVKRYLRNYRSG